MRKARRTGSVDDLLLRQPWDTLAERLSGAGFDAAAVAPRLRAYAEMLLDWNRNVSNLISRNDEERFVERHLGESLLIAGAARDAGAATWLDLGSGGGLPAIPLALLGVGTRWTLVESRRMKTLFLRKALDELGLSDVEVVCARLENLVEKAAETGPRFDAFTSRATLRLAPTLELAATFVRTGGTAFLWKGERLDEELRSKGVWSQHWERKGTVKSEDTLTSVVSFLRN